VTGESNIYLHVINCNKEEPENIIIKKRRNKTFQNKKNKLYQMFSQQKDNIYYGYFYIDSKETSLLLRELFKKQMEHLNKNVFLMETNV
jgi:hypothetical protein